MQSSVSTSNAIQPLFYPESGRKDGQKARKMYQSNEKPRWFFIAWEEDLREPEILRNFRAAP